MKDKKVNKNVKQSHQDNKLIWPLLYEKIDLNQLNNNNTTEKPYNQYFYDKISKKFIHKYEEGIDIYNSSCKKLKKKISFKLGK